MHRIIVTILIAAYLLLPIAVWAQARLKDPLDYSLKTYGLMLAIALLGGFVSWYAKVRRGDLPGWSMFHLIGELMTPRWPGCCASGSASGPASRRCSLQRARAWRGTWARAASPCSRTGR